MAPELQILFPNGSVLAVQVYIDSTTGPIPWDGTVPIAPPVGGATAANQVTEIASLASIDGKLTSPIAIVGALTDTQLRATPVPVSGTLAISTAGLAVATLQTIGNASLSSIDGKLTNPLPVSGTLSIGTIGTIAVTGPLTDTQLRATAVPVSGTLSIGTIGVVAVTGPLTDTQLRATPVPISGSVNSTISSGTVTANAGTNLNTSLLNLETTQVLIRANTNNLDVALSTRTKPADQQHAIIDSGSVNSTVSGSVSITGGVNSTITSGVITSITNAVAITNANLDSPLSTKASAAKQDTGNTSLASIDTKLTNPLPISGTVNSTVSGTVAVSNMIPAVETGLATSAKQDTAQISLDRLTLVQGTTDTTARGPLIQGLVSDARLSWNDGIIAPISITTDGRLRVATSPSDSYIDFFVGSDMYGDADIFGIPPNSLTLDSYI